VFTGVANVGDEVADCRRANAERGACPDNRDSCVDDCGRGKPVTAMTPEQFSAQVDTDWSVLGQQITDPEAGLDRHTLRVVVQSLRNRAFSLPFGNNGRPWMGAADHVAGMIAKGKE